MFLLLSGDCCCCCLLSAVCDVSYARAYAPYGGGYEIPVGVLRPGTSFLAVSQPSFCFENHQPSTINDQNHPPTATNHQPPPSARHHCCCHCHKLRRRYLGFRLAEKCLHTRRFLRAYERNKHACERYYYRLYNKTEYRQTNRQCNNSTQHQRNDVNMHSFPLYVVSQLLN